MNHKEVLLSEEQRYWIERTADLECAMAMKRFMDLCNINLKDKSEKEQEMLKKLGCELIDTYTFLKELRIKMELQREPKDNNKADLSEVNN